MHPVEQPPRRQRLGIAARRHRGDAEPVREVRDPCGALFAYQFQQSVMTFSGTFAHGGSLSGG